MLILRPYFDALFHAPLRGANLDELGERFIGYDGSVLTGSDRRAKEAGTSLGIALQEGVYLQAAGPQYETPAEIRMMFLLGADARWDEHRL